MDLFSTAVTKSTCCVYSLLYLLKRPYPPPSLSFSISLCFYFSLFFLLYCCSCSKRPISCLPSSLFPFPFPQLKKKKYLQVSSITWHFSVSHHFFLLQYQCYILNFLNLYVYMCVCACMCRCVYSNHKDQKIE